MAEIDTGTEFSAIEQRVMEALEDVIDPELGVDMVNLGLIYDINVDSTGKCLVIMTLTTMGCPLGNLLSNQIMQAVLTVSGINDCEIKLVWQPTWSVSRMSRFAKVALGIHG